MTPRRCRSCGLTFATPDSIRTHKRDGFCRSPDVLRVIGWRETPKGWTHPPLSAPKPAPLQRRLRSI